MSDLLPLTKLHGLGNDFLVLVLDGAHAAPDDPAAFARRVCDRHLGVGADGLLTAVAGPAPDAWEMTLHNADGSRAEMSGNGIRCFAQAVTRHTGTALPTTLRIQTDGGLRTVTVNADPAGDPDTVLASVTMGTPRPGVTLPAATPDQPAMTGRTATWDLGNPHLVVEVGDTAAVDPAVDGPAWEALFPGGMNVHFVTVAGDGSVDQVTWERGAGVTQACGTGATAAALSARAWRHVGSPVTVRMPGGTVQVDLVEDGTGEPVLTGPSVWIASVEVRA